MRAAFVQMDCHFGDVVRNTDHAVELLHREDADLYVLPELFNTGYLFRDRKEVERLAEEVPDGPTCQALLRAAKEKQTYIVAGVAERDGERLYNSSVLIGPGGWLATYRKIHLFLDEKEWFDAGDRPFFVVDIGLCRVGLMICFDWIFPESMRSLALAGADLVAHSANLVMPYCQDAMVTRCLENHLFAITANRIGTDVRDDREVGFTGQSQITAPRGRILVRADADSEQVGVAQIDIQAARDKHINPKNHLLEDRRPQLYHPALSGRGSN